MRPCKGDRYFVCSRCNETATTNGCEPGNEDKCQDPKAPGGYYYCVYDEYVFKPVAEDIRLRAEMNELCTERIKDRTAAMAKLVTTVQDEMRDTRDECDSTIADLDELREHTKHTVDRFLFDTACEQRDSARKEVFTIQERALNALLERDTLLIALKYALVAKEPFDHQDIKDRAAKVLSERVARGRAELAQEIYNELSTNLETMDDTRALARVVSRLTEGS